MTCDGIAVLTAQTPDVNLAQHFEDDEANREAFVQFLRERGIEVLQAPWVKRSDWQIHIGQITLHFTPTGIRVRGSRYSSTNNQRAELLLAAQQYAASVNQANILAAIQAMGLAAENFSYDTAGALSFEINLGA